MHPKKTNPNPTPKNNMFKLIPMLFQRTSQAHFLFTSPHTNFKRNNKISRKTNRVTKYRITAMRGEIMFWIHRQMDFGFLDFFFYLSHDAWFGGLIWIFEFLVIQVLYGLDFFFGFWRDCFFFWIFFLFCCGFFSWCFSRLELFFCF